MSKIIKICKKHGELTIEQVLIENRKHGKYLRCKFCSRKNDILNKRGISEEKYDEMKLKQNNKCAICNKEETHKGRTGDIVPLAVDHCHRCQSHIRELICQSCNTALGKINDSTELLYKAIAYLEKHTHVQ